jgi:hypothetical protein
MRGVEPYTTCFEIHDLSLPPHYYLGFSAHTGDVADNHDVYGVVTKNLGPPLHGADDQPPAAGDAEVKEARHTLDVRGEGERGGGGGS